MEAYWKGIVIWKGILVGDTNDCRANFFNCLCNINRLADELDGKEISEEDTNLVLIASNLKACNVFLLLPMKFCLCLEIEPSN